MISRATLYEYYELVHGTFTSHPTIPIKALTAAGYELQPPIPFLGFDYYVFYPNPFRLAASLIRQRGALAMWRGAGERLVQKLLWKAIYRRLSSADVSRLVEAMFPGVDRFWLDAVQDAAGQMVASAVTHPLSVVVMRKVAQLVSEQEVLDHSPWGVAREIYQQEGWLGFYAGLTPLLLFTLCECASYSFVRHRLLQGDPMDMAKIWRRWFFPLTWLSKSLTVVSMATAIGALQPKGRREGPYATWMHCLVDMLRQKRLFRGAYSDLPSVVTWLMMFML